MLGLKSQLAGGFSSRHGADTSRPGHLDRHRLGRPVLRGRDACSVDGDREWDVKRLDIRQWARQRPTAQRGSRRTPLRGALHATSGTATSPQVRMRTIASTAGSSSSISSGSSAFAAPGITSWRSHRRSRRGSTWRRTSRRCSGGTGRLRIGRRTLHDAVNDERRADPASARRSSRLTTDDGPTEPSTQEACV